MHTNNDANNIFIGRILPNRIKSVNHERRGEGGRFAPDGTVTKTREDAHVANAFVNHNRQLRAEGMEPCE